MSLMAKVSLSNEKSKKWQMSQMASVSAGKSLLKLKKSKYWQMSLMAKVSLSNENFKKWQMSQMANIYTGKSLL